MDHHWDCRTCHTCCLHFLGKTREWDLVCIFLHRLLGNRLTCFHCSPTEAHYFLSLIRAIQSRTTSRVVSCPSLCTSHRSLPPCVFTSYSHTCLSTINDLQCWMVVVFVLRVIGGLFVYKRCYTWILTAHRPISRIPSRLPSGIPIKRVL